MGARDATAFGEIHGSGGSHSIGTRRSGQALPAHEPAAPAAAWRPLSAATSAVSAPWRRLPAANTPGREVRSAASTDGPRVPGSIASPAVTASSWSGIQSAVNTTVSHATRRVGAAVEAAQLHGLDPRPAVDRGDALCGSRAACASGAPRRRGRAASDWWRGCSVVIPTGLAPAVREREQRREAHVLGADDERAFARPAPFR